MTPGAEKLVTRCSGLIPKDSERDPRSSLVFDLKIFWTYPKASKTSNLRSNEYDMSWV